MNKFFLLLISYILLSSCTKQIRLESLNGYWEIDCVENNGEILKQYKFNEFIEYFQLSDSIGFRMKLKPSFIGKFTGNLEKIPFKINKVTDHNLEIDYQSPLLKNEFLLEATNDVIAISNHEGLTYFYKKYTPITIE